MYNVEILKHFTAKGITIWYYNLSL